MFNFIYNTRIFKNQFCNNISMELINNLAENYPKNKEPLIYNVVLKAVLLMAYILEEH